LPRSSGKGRRKRERIKKNSEKAHRLIIRKLFAQERDKKPLKYLVGKALRETIEG